MPIGGGKLEWTETGDNRPISIPCGQCIGCRLERSRQWAMRILHESQLYEWSSFVTLTYDDEHLPSDGSLRYRDFQLFMKKFRKAFGPTRFFMAGEYGELLGRPHYHAVLFGTYFPDRKEFKNLSSGFKLYTSETLSRYWTDGFASVGDVSFESAAYVARYCMKKVTGDAAMDHYRRLDLNTGEFYWLVPEFCHMSLKPGIGREWFDKYWKQTYPRDYVIVNGMKVRPPKYYDRLLSLVDGFMSDDIGFSRELNASVYAEECTPERLRARELVARARAQFKVRPL